MLLIFDWDGTLSDSTARIVDCMQKAMKQVGLPVSHPDEIKDLIGLSLPETIRRLHPLLGDAESQALKEAYSEVYAREDKEPCALYPGVSETLHVLRDKGYGLAVATGKSRRGLDRVLSGLGLSKFFHASRCADETLSKPDPLMLYELLTEMKYSPGESIMVGDTEFDMQMAQSAQMPRVAVTYGAHSAVRLQKYDPLLSVDYFPEIAKILPD